MKKVLLYFAKFSKMNIGLFFGSFNPVHNGHLLLAQYFAEFTELDQVWFVVSPQNPFKERKNLLDQNQRLALVQDCLVDSPKLRASDIEFHLPIPSYTIDTLTYLKEKHQSRFSLIVGSDNLYHFQKWKNYEEVLRHYSLLVYPRPGFLDAPLLSHEKVTMYDAPVVGISSTFIRKALREGKSIRYFVPNEILDELTSLAFYKR